MNYIKNSNAQKSNIKSKKELGIYIHIPFCLSRCNYCDFYSNVKRDTYELNNYVNALCENIKIAGKQIGEEYIVDTVFIGGGTPSVMSGEQYQMISEAINESFYCGIIEFTSEGNPNTLTESLMQKMRDCGINRLSIGVQTTNDEILSLLCRHSKKEDTIKCLNAAVGIFDNISCDIMVGLPNQTENDLNDCLDLLLSYGIKHVSCYNLQLEEGTELHQKVVCGKLSVPDEDFAVKLYDIAYKRLKAAGFSRYEVSNFANTSFECSHNFRYWKCKEYIGFGPSSSSCIGGERFSVIGDINEYIKIANSVNYKIKYPEKMFEQLETLTKKDMLEEKIMLGLRTNFGININDIAREFGISFKDKFADILLKNKDYLLIDENTITIKEEYMYVMNSIISDFLL